MFKKTSLIIGFLVLMGLSGCEKQPITPEQGAQQLSTDAASEVKVNQAIEQTPNPASEMESYSHTKLGFKIDIPSDTEVSEYESGISVVRRLSDEICTEYEGLSCFISLSISRQIYPDGIDQYFETRAEMSDFQTETFLDFPKAYVRVGARLERGERSEEETEQKKIVFENSANGERVVYEINLEWPKSLESKSETKSILEEFNRGIDTFTLISE